MSAPSGTHVGDVVFVNGEAFNGRGYRVCGVANQRGRLCGRIGACPFHGSAGGAAAAGSTPSAGAKKRARAPGDSVRSQELPPQKARFKRSWTAEEHTTFLQAMKRHGKGKWKEISKDVATRTANQCQSHAQKYFLRQAKSDGERKKKSIHDQTLGSDERPDCFDGPSRAPAQEPAAASASHTPSGTYIPRHPRASVIPLRNDTDVPNTPTVPPPVTMRVDAAPDGPKAEVDVDSIGAALLVGNASPPADGTIDTVSVAGGAEERTQEVAHAMDDEHQEIRDSGGDLQVSEIDAVSDDLVAKSSSARVENSWAITTTMPAVPAETSPQEIPLQQPSLFSTGSLSRNADVSPGVATLASVAVAASSPLGMDTVADGGGIEPWTVGPVNSGAQANMAAISAAMNAANGNSGIAVMQTGNGMATVPIVLPVSALSNLQQYAHLFNAGFPNATGGGAFVPPPQPRLRVTVHQNGKGGGSMALMLPDTLELFFRNAEKKLRFDGSFSRVFTRSGGEITSLDEMCQDDMLWLSGGEDFRSPV